MSGVVRFFIASFLTALCFPTLAALAEPIGWIEKFSLADDRTDVLGELIPGTDDYFFYHTLHHQNTGNLAQAEAMLERWLASKAGATTPAINAMTDRQRLLTYDQSPQQTIDYLITRLGVKLDHVAPPAPDKRWLPSELDNNLLDPISLIQRSINDGEDLTGAAVVVMAERFLANQSIPGNYPLEYLLRAVGVPSVDGLDELVIRDLLENPKGSRQFGNLAAHQYLTLKQIQTVASRVPEVADDQALVDATLARLQPSSDIDLSQDDQARLGYLRRLEAYTTTLPPSYNTLKAAASFGLLRENLDHGIFDRELFDRYLSLPRSSPIVPESWINRSTDRADLSKDFSKVALLRPVGDEQPVVTAHLEHFFERDASADAFRDKLKPGYLNSVLAETKLLAGIGPSDRWYGMIPEDDRRALRDRVELRLAADNPKQFSGDQPTAITVDVKNIDELTIRIYEINSLAYHRDHSEPLDTDIDLDGLVATDQRVQRFDQPAIRRHRETLPLPEIVGRGVWVVDLIGKGMRTRALIRRGGLDYVQQIHADGLALTVVDENRATVATAKLWIGSRQFEADENGRIIIPLVTEALTREAVISDGKVAAAVMFVQPAESYELTSAMHIDRTLMQSGGTTDLLIRPRLSMSGEIVDPSMLEQVGVRIESVDVDGITTSSEVTDVQLSQAGELVVPVRVPSRLSKLVATVTGKIRRLTDSQTQSVSTSHRWNIAGVRASDHTHDAFLTRNADDYVIEVRGRNGERIPRAIVSLKIKTLYTRKPVEVTLQADDAGRVTLGPLPNAVSLRFGVSGGQQHVCPIDDSPVHWPDAIHASTGNPIRLPLPLATKESTQRYRLIGVVAGRAQTDQDDRLAAEDGFLVISGLDAGDYRLVDRMTGQSHLIAIVDGPVIDRVAVGPSRQRSISPARPLSIASINRDATGLRIALSGETKLARVHIYAKQYLDGDRTLRSLDLAEPTLWGRSTVTRRCGYVSGLRLGDEYQYVMRRRAAQKFPGVMLPQPGLILNPWETEETSNASQSARPGQAVPSSDARDGSRLKRSKQPAYRQASQDMGSDYDFLADPGVVVTGLIPDEAGIVTVPMDVIQGMPIVEVVVCDPVTTVTQTVASELGDAATMDQRLAKPLDLETPVSMQRTVLVASPDLPLDLASLGDARVQVYGSVASLFPFYRVLVEDSRFDEFEEISRWHTLDENQKRSAYSRLASHELHVFLWVHDRTFFDEIVKPYLANKKEKQFVDDWLLGNDLAPYTRLGKYQTLNAAERAMLAMRVPALRETIVRELREVVSNQTVDYSVVGRSIDTALSFSNSPMMLGDFFGGSVEGDVAAGDPFGDAEMEMGGMAMGGGGMGGGISGEMGGMFGASPPRKTTQRGRAAGSLRGGAGGRSEGYFFEGRSDSVGRQAPFFRDLDSTRQWAESQWDRARTVGRPSPESIIGTKSFWRDLAGQNEGSIGVSAGLLEVTDSRHAALLALAFSGLPLQPGKISLPTERGQTYRPEHAVAVITKRLKDLDRTDRPADILIGQRFSPIAQPDAPELTEFVTSVAYQGQTVLSNPTNRKRTLDVLWQLPAGSVPLAGGLMTDSKTIVIEPFAVAAITYKFYFPSAGNFDHYPATVADGDELVAQAPAKSFVVTDQPSPPDQSDWNWIARRGDADKIAEFLATANLRDLDWMKVAHRMGERDVYRVVIDELSQHRLSIAPLWAYSLRHNQTDDLRAFLSLRDDLLDRVGPTLESTLVDIDPIDRDRHEMLEYSPLVRARIHRLGQENEILNPTFMAQYQSFLETLAYRKSIDPSSRLALSYYLLIQNRIGESIDQFNRVDAEQIESQLQYDYMDAYLAMHQGRYDRAAAIAGRHADHPIARWQTRFGQLRSQLAGTAPGGLVLGNGKNEAGIGIDPSAGDLAVLDRERQQAEAAQSSPEVIAHVEGDRVRIDHRNTTAAKIRLYNVDLELLFSKAPFVRDDLKRMAMVTPADTRDLAFDSPQGTAMVDLDENLRRQTWLVEVVSGASRSTTLAHGGNLTTYVSEAMGQLQSTDTSTGQPIGAAYVKVYAKYPSGEVKFYKDGYTDVRGRFDYASVSAGDAKDATRFAILVLSDEYGATLHDVGVPK